MNLSTIKEYFSRAYTLYKPRWKILWGTMFLGGILMLLPIAAGIIDLVTAAAAGKAPAGLVSMVLGAFGALWVFSWTEAAFCVALSVPDTGLKAAFVNGRPRAMPLMKANLMAYALMLGASILFVIPGWIFAVWFIFTPLAVLFDNHRGMDALMASKNFVKGRFWAVFFRLLAAWGFIGLIQIVPVVGQLASLWLMPLPYIITILIYQDLKKDAPTYVASGKGKAGVILAGTLGLLPILALPVVLPKMMPKMMAMMMTAKGSPAPSASQQPGVAAATIPDVPVNGIVIGKPFKMENSKIDLLMGILHLRQGKENFAEREIKVFLFKEGMNPQGKSFDIPGETTVHVHIGSMESGDKTPGWMTVAAGFKMRLEFASERDGKLPGKISLDIPAPGELIGRTRVSGTFLAEITRRAPEKQAETAKVGAAEKEPPQPMTASSSVSSAEKEIPKSPPKSEATPEEIAARKDARAEERRLAAEKRRAAAEELKDKRKRVMRACENEIGIFCHSARNSTWRSISCLKRRPDVLLPACLEKLEALKKK